MKTVALLVMLFAARSAWADRVYLREADAPRAMFPASTAATRKTLALSDSELVAIGRLLGRQIQAKTYPYLEVRNDRGPLGVIFMLDVIGQTQPITFAVAVTKDGAVEDVRVMVYRETHGEEIEDRRFRKQFVGKRVNDPIAIGKNIDAISGATISSRSEAFAVRKTLALCEILRQHDERTSRAP